MKGKVINVELGTWPKDKKPFWAVSVAQEGKEPIKLYASTKEIGEGLKSGQEYDFTLKTTGMEGQPLKYPYITGAVPIGKTEEEPWPGEDAQPTPKPPAQAPKPPTVAPQSNYVAPDAKDRAIARAVALKAAVEYIVQSQQAEAVDAVIEVAERFERWLTRI